MTWCANSSRVCARFCIPLRPKRDGSQGQAAHRPRAPQWDNGWTDIAHAFLTIHQAQTGSGRQVTYKASRTATTGHADLAWATMHALINDPLGQIDEAGFSGRRGFARSF